eukprot:4877862-Amphidinium_carterae.1
MPYVPTGLHTRQGSNFPAFSSHSLLPLPGSVKMQCESSYRPNSGSKIKVAQVSPSLVEKVAVAVLISFK